MGNKDIMLGLQSLFVARVLKPVELLFAGGENTIKGKKIIGEIDSEEQAAEVYLTGREVTKLRWKRSYKHINGM